MSGSFASSASRVTSQLELRTFTRGDYEAVFDLYERAWPGDVERRKTAFRWLQEGNPFRHEGRGYVLAFHEGKLAGYWGRMPMRFYRRGRPFDATFSQEALVDPDFRRRGVGRRLMERAISDSGLYLSLWHNSTVVSILRSAGWASLGQIPVDRKTYRYRALADWKVSDPWARTAALPVMGLVDRVRPRRPSFRSGAEGARVEEVERFPSCMTEFFHRVAPSFELMADRTEPTLNWRYADIPHRSFRRLVARREGEVVGYMVLEVEDLGEGRLRRGTVVDSLVDAEHLDALKALVAAADARFQEMGADFVAGLTTIQGGEEAFRLSGFRRRRPRATPTLTLMYLDRREDPTPSPGSSYTRWLVTFGDSDGHMW